MQNIQSKDIPKLGDVKESTRVRANKQRRKAISPTHSGYLAMQRKQQGSMAELERQIEGKNTVKHLGELREHVNQHRMRLCRAWREFESAYLLEEVAE